MNPSRVEYQINFDDGSGPRLLVVYDTAGPDEVSVSDVGSKVIVSTDHLEWLIGALTAAWQIHGRISEAGEPS